MRVLKETGIDRIAVLLRDPRDAFVSWVNHLRTLGPKARDYHSRIYHWPMEYYLWTLEKQFSYQIRTFLPVVVNWIKGLVRTILLRQKGTSRFKSCTTMN